MTALIFANGELERGDWVQSYLSSALMVIAANGGSEHLWRLDHVPDAVIGDLDSLSPQVWEWLQEANVNMIQFAEEKDENDLELALLYAVAHTAEPIKVFAAAGGRLDQTLANIQLLAHPALVGRQVELVKAHERAWLVTAETEISGAAGDTVSLIPLYGDVQVARTQGLKWPLIDETLQFGPARGISNKMTSKVAAITLSSGKLLCIHTRQEWDR